MLAKRVLHTTALSTILCAVAMAQSTHERDLFDRINHERERAGLSKLEWSPQLAEAARAHAKREADHAQISHDFAGEPALQARIASTGLRFNNCGENVARGTDVAAIADGFMRSHGHRENILDADYNAAGIGIVESNGEFYVAENFARVFKAYSAAEFRDALIATLERARGADRAPELRIVADPAVESAACSQDSDIAKKLSARLNGPGAAMVFTDSDPTTLPDSWKQFAADASINRVALGVCFRPDDKLGYANFSVASVFSR